VPLTRPSTTLHGCRDARTRQGQAELKGQLEQQLAYLYRCQAQVAEQFQAMQQERDELLDDLHCMIEHCRELVQDEPEQRGASEAGQVRDSSQWPLGNRVAAYREGPRSSV
jgi:hypothetical protein